MKGRRRLREKDLESIRLDSRNSAEDIIFLTRAWPATQDLSVLSRHSGMPSAGIQFGPVLDSGQNLAGMTEGQACS